MLRLLVSKYLFLYLLIGVQSTYATDIEKTHASSAEIYHLIKKLKVMDRVLYIAAHPDDENNKLLTYLAKGWQAETAYLSLTRGEGGQNFIGKETGEELGVLRSQESISARNLDGSTQFFTRAKDFGFSKSAAETLEIWGENDILFDIVYVIRYFRPDVIISRFASHIPDPHGHHQASALLCEKAFELAANPEIFPEQLSSVKPWQAKQLLWNIYTEAGVKSIGGPVPPKDDYLKIEIPAFNAIIGKNYGNIASESRNLHRCQAMGSKPDFEASTEYFEIISNKAGTNIALRNEFVYASTIYHEYEQQINNLLNKFDCNNPSDIVDDLVSLSKWINQHKKEKWAIEKLNDVDQLIIFCLGISAKATTNPNGWVIGDSASLTIHIHKETDCKHNVSLQTIAIPILDREYTLNEQNIKYNTFSFTAPVGLKNQPNIPSWLTQAKQDRGKYTPTNDPWDVISVNPYPVSNSVQLTFSVDNHTFVHNIAIFSYDEDALLGITKSPLVIKPPIYGSFNNSTLLVNDKQQFKIPLILYKTTANDLDGSIRLIAPKSWRVTPSQIPIYFSDRQDTINITFDISAPEDSFENIGFEISTERGVFNQSIQIIDYPHIVRQEYFPIGQLKVVNTNIKNTAQKIAYIPGKEDGVDQALANFVTQLDVIQLSNIKNINLDQYDAIVLGTRLYNTFSDVAKYHSAWHRYIENGGVLLIQYNTTYDLQSTEISPYPIQLSSARITNENSAIQILESTHQVMNTPNKITELDFNNWVQDRAIFIPYVWPDNLTPILSGQDLNEAPQHGLLLTGKIGKGYFTYTSLTLFRQLANAVPGSYRLLANILSQGKQGE